MRGGVQCKNDFLDINETTSIPERQMPGSSSHQQSQRGWSRIQGKSDNRSSLNSGVLWQWLLGHGVPKDKQMARLPSLRRCFVMKISGKILDLVDKNVSLETVLGTHRLFPKSQTWRPSNEREVMSSQWRTLQYVPSESSQQLSPKVSSAICQGVCALEEGKYSDFLRDISRYLLEFLPISQDNKKLS